MIDVTVKCLCDICGSDMPPIKGLDDLIPKSATNTWDMSAFDICPVCALKLDNEFLKLKLNLPDR